MAYEKILYEVDQDGIARITLNEPEKMNPLGWPTFAELLRAFKEAEKDDNARVIIIKGAGRCFSAGHDLGSEEDRFKKPRGRAEYGAGSVWDVRAHVQGHMEYYFDMIWNLWKPVIAQLHGFCLAGATELACFCDLMTVSENLRFGYPPTRWMAVGDIIALYSWHAGRRVAMDMGMGRIISGKECAEYGFANYCFPEDKLDEETTRLAKRIALIHPELLALEKRQVCRTFDIRKFRISCEYCGEFDSLSMKGAQQQDYGYRTAVEKYGLSTTVKKINEPWGGV